jgi:hypothetical protein
MGRDAKSAEKRTGLEMKPEERALVGTCWISTDTGATGGRRSIEFIFENSGNQLVEYTVYPRATVYQANVVTGVHGVYDVDKYRDTHQYLPVSNDKAMEILHDLVVVCYGEPLVFLRSSEKEEYADMKKIVSAIQQAFKKRMQSDIKEKQIKEAKDMQNIIQKTINKVLRSPALYGPLSIIGLAAISSSVAYMLGGGVAVFSSAAAIAAVLALSVCYSLKEDTRAKLAQVCMPSKHAVRENNLRQMLQVERLVKKAESTEDPLIMEKVCKDLRKVTVSLRSELQERISTLVSSIVSIAQLRDKVGADCNAISTEQELGVNKALLADLDNNLSRLRECQTRIEATVKLAGYMDRFLETKIELLDASVNVVRINDICHTYCDMVRMFKGINTKMEHAGLVAESKTELLIESQERQA